MCYWKRRAEDKLNTAKKNITVYKVVKCRLIKPLNFTSAYQGFLYSFGETYTTYLDESKYYRSVDRGFHSYSDVKYNKCLNGGMLVAKARKFYYKADIVYYTNCYIIECIIPKGSKYYFNGTDYVSDSIKPICIILPEDATFDKLDSDCTSVIKKDFKITTHNL